MKVTQDNYQGFYQQGVSNGFRIVDARQYYVKEANMSPDLEQMIAVPWTINGMQAFGYTITRVGVAEERRLGYRQTHTHEFWVYDPQKGLVDPDKLYPNGYQLADAYGNAVYLNDAFQIMDEFATAATYYPHVFMAAEFAEARNYLNGRMGLPPVNAANYKEYLDHIENQIRSGQYVFVGKITRVEDMQIARETISEFKKFN